MALALLTLDERDGSRYAFRADLGGNRYYRYTVGRPAVDDRDGFLVLRDPRHRSDLFGPVADAALGRLRFDIPAGLLDRENDTVQLWSYRTPDGGGRCRRARCGCRSPATARRATDRPRCRCRPAGRPGRRR